MGERTQYTPGTFCWTDLTTTDQDAAKAFYTGLFGWEIEDLPVGQGIVYSMARVDGKDVAAISPQPEAMRSAGAPPAWNSYVCVEAADATAARARELGATVVTEPFDVMGAGRMAVIQDPQGTVFMLWQPNDHKGAQLVNASGALVWNELATPDVDASVAFYRDLFGWNISPMDTTSLGPYLSVKVGEANNGGMRPVDPPGAPPHWLVYFGVEDIDAAQAKVDQLGGTWLAGPIEIQIAKLGIVRDPQGAAFAIYDGQMEP